MLIRAFKRVPVVDHLLQIMCRDGFEQHSQLLSVWVIEQEPSLLGERQGIVQAIFKWHMNPVIMQALQCDVSLAQDEVGMRFKEQR